MTPDTLDIDWESKSRLHITGEENRDRVNLTLSDTDVWMGTATPDVWVFFEVGSGKLSGVVFPVKYSKVDEAELRLILGSDNFEYLLSVLEESPERGQTQAINRISFDPEVLNAQDELRQSIEANLRGGGVSD